MERAIRSFLSLRLGGKEKISVALHHNHKEGALVQSCIWKGRTSVLSVSCRNMLSERFSISWKLHVLHVLMSPVSYTISYSPLPSTSFGPYDCLSWLILHQSELDSWWQNSVRWARNLSLCTVFTLFFDWANWKRSRPQKVCNSDQEIFFFSI